MRAVGRIVVWVDAAAELSTIRISSRARKVPKPEVPNTAWPSTDITSLELSGLPRPMPVVPMPANDWAARITTT